MNLQSEQYDKNLDALVEINGDGINSMRGSKKLAYVEFQEKDWDTMVNLLEQTVNFQPEMLMAFRALATKKDMENSIVTLRQSAVSSIRKVADEMILECRHLQTENENLRNSILNQLSQDGKNREQFFKDSKEEYARMLAQIKQEISQAAKKPLTKTVKILLSMLGTAQVLHLVWSVVQWVWLR